MPKVAKNTRITDSFLFFPYGHSLRIILRMYLYMYINGATNVIKYWLKFNGQFSPSMITANYFTEMNDCLTELVNQLVIWCWIGISKNRWHKQIQEWLCNLKSKIQIAIWLLFLLVAFIFLWLFSIMKTITLWLN